MVSSHIDKKVIGFVSMSDPFRDRVAWSGTNYKLREAIESVGYEIRWISYGRSFIGNILNFVLKFWNHSFGKKSKWLTGFHFPPITRMWAKELDANPETKNCDFLFFPGGIQMSLYTNVKKPCISHSDSTLHIMMEYYWKDVNKKSLKMAQELDIAASQKAILNIRSSQWAHDSLIRDYHCEETKCYVLEFGPNIDTKDIRQSQPFKGGQFRVLFSGVSGSVRVVILL